MKKKMIARVIAMIVIMALALPSQWAMAATTASGTDGDITWALENGTLTISGSGAMTDYSSKSSVPWYSYVSSIENVVICDGVTSIGAWAFYGCSNLTNVTIPDSVTTIGEYAFVSCTSLTSVTIPESVTSIARRAFQNCSSLTSVTVPDGVTCINEYTFSGCSSLTDITIPSSVTSVAAYAFYKSANLASIYYGGSEEEFADISVGDYNDPFLNATVYYAEEEGYIAWALDDGTLTISGSGAMTDYSSKSSVPWYSYVSSIENVVICDGVTSIGAWAFYGCSNLTSVTIPDSVTSIGEYAFVSCTSLTSVTIPESVTSIARRAFQNCSTLTSVIVPDGVTCINEYTFSGCSSLTDITIPSSVTSVAAYAFYKSANLASIYYGGSEEEFADISVGEHNDSFLSAAVYYADVAVESVSLDKNSITLYVGESDTLVATVLPEDATNIKVTWASSDKSVATISGGVVTAVSAGNAVITVTTEDGGYTAECSVKVIVGGTMGDLTWVLEDGTLTISGSGAMKDYSSASAVPWYSYIGSIEEVVICDGVTSIGARAFRGCSSLTSVAISDSVISIGELAFYGCSSLTNVTLPENITGIARYAFYSCSALTDITIPDNVTSIGESAFRGCSSLTDITLPSSVTSIGQYAFYKSSNLASIYYGGSKKEFAAISVGDYNDPFLTATVYCAVVAVESVELDCDSITLEVGESETLVVTVLPEDADNTNVTWESSDESVATVSDGVVTAVSAGSAVITVTTNDGGYTAECSVTVKSRSVDIEIGSVTAYAGAEVTLPITLSNNPGIAGLNLVISYDNTLLTPVEISLGSDLTIGTLVSNIQQGGDMTQYEHVTALWYNPADFTDNGEIFLVTFAVSEDAEEGNIPISLSYELGDVVNQKYEEIDLNITNGNISVVMTMGDIYSDGEVNVKDTVKLSQYLAEWAVELNTSEMKAADIVSDGEINMKDLVKLSQYLAGWDVELQTMSLMAMTLFGSSESGTVAFEVRSVDASAGEYVDVPVYITENSGMAGFNVQLNYDNTLLTPVSITQGEALGVGSITSNIQQGGDMTRFEFVTALWYNPANITTTGLAFTVRFLVAENAEGEIALNLTYNKNNVCDQEYNNLNVEITDGVIVLEGATTELGVKLADGVQLRIGDGVGADNKITTDSGLRFIATVDTTNTLAADATEIGIAIWDGGFGSEPTQDLTADPSTYGEPAVTKAADNYQVNDRVFSLAITNIAETNFNRIYVAAPYVVVGGVTYYGTPVARTPYQVATGILVSGTESVEGYAYSTDEEALIDVLNAYANQTGARITLDADYNVGYATYANDADAFFTYSDAVDNGDGSYTITLTATNNAAFYDYAGDYYRINNAKKDMIEGSGVFTSITTDVQGSTMTIIFSVE